MNWRDFGCNYFLFVEKYGLYLLQKGVTLHVTGLSNLLYLKNEVMNLADFLHADTNSEKLQITLITFLMGVLTNRLDLLGLRTLKYAISQECIDELS